ncbi:lipocalin-like domain-containing protein [Bordetella genomosp. 13]|uniref:lipocalin-like domain-containing protein n=1 Tax=Bordetella genomosp. 13 TaxID=463040 RepID=UPI001C92FD01|nr:lipocalin-like domain-containing protein [Bordetella genomosp. 13]
MTMTARRAAALAAAATMLSATAWAQAPNKVLGTWRMVSAEIEQDGRTRPAYGAAPNGLLVFTQDGHFVEVLTDAAVPRFAKDARGQGTDEENRAAMAGGIGFFGTYTVDADGEFSGNRVTGSTFPNWVGSARTRKELQLVVQGDRMTERFQRPEGSQVHIVWRRER